MNVELILRFVRIKPLIGLNHKHSYMPLKTFKQWSFFVLIFSLFTSIRLSATADFPRGYNKAEFDNEIAKRYSSMEGIFKIDLNEEILLRVQAYLHQQKTWTCGLIGRSTVYFPIFNQALRKYNLPTELKYLAVLESSLKQKAKSGAGAVGLWQFMKGTALLYGLEVNDKVDERNDIYAASEAAAKYLHALHSIYNSWELALAAYNAGPGRVNRAIKSAGTDEYTVVVKFLPKETQNYLGKFQAVKFMMEYYDEFDINPVYPPLDLQVIDTVKVYEKIDFSTLAAGLDYHIDAIKELNPMYNKSYIPASKSGYNLVLPVRLKHTFKSRLEYPNPYEDLPTDYKNSTYYKVTLEEFLERMDSISRAEYVNIKHRVDIDETLKSIALRYRVFPEYLQAWNNISSQKIARGQILDIYIPAVTVSHQIKLDIPNYISVQDRSSDICSRKMFSPNEFQKSIEIATECRDIYVVQRGETLLELCNRFNIGRDELLALNGLNSDDVIMPGMKLILWKAS